MTDLTRGTFPAMMKDPFADALTQPFWDAAAEGRLVAPRCTVCGTFVLPPQPFCFDVPEPGLRVGRPARHRDHLHLHRGAPPAGARSWPTWCPTCRG